MKTRLSFTIFLLFACFILLKGQVDDFKRYSLESGIVEYILSGMQVGTSTLYFDNYGMQEASYENAVMEMMGIRQETESVNYLDGYWQYNWDKKNNTATKIKNTALANIVENAEDGDLHEAGLEMLKAMGGEKIGNENILGKPCDIWEVKQMGTKIWVWKGVTLKSVTNMMGFTMIREAKSFEADASVPPEKLSLPEGVEFNEVSMPAQVQDMMNNYNDDD